MKKTKITIILCVLILLLPQSVFASEQAVLHRTNSSLIQSSSYEFKKSNQYTVELSYKDLYDVSGKTVWVKYKAPSDGYVTIKAKKSGKEESGNGYIALYDSKKSKLLSSKTIYYKTNSYWSNNCFGVKKNTVYYFQVRAYTPIIFSLNHTKVKDVSGGTKSSARKLTQAKAKKGTILTSDHTSDWYKIHLTKDSSYLKISYNINTRGSFQISLYSSDQLWKSWKVTKTSSEQTMTIRLYNKTTKKTQKIPKGDYYIQISRGNALSSGYYTIKYK